jgi:hypothetical protein
MHFTLMSQLYNPTSGSIAATWIKLVQLNQDYVGKEQHCSGEVQGITLQSMPLWLRGRRHARLVYPAADHLPLLKNDCLCLSMQVPSKMALPKVLLSALVLLCALVFASADATCSADGDCSSIGSDWICVNGGCARECA